MNKSIKKTAAFLAVLAILIITTSSCNRGTGCPNNFSIEKGLEHIVNIVK